MTNIGGALRTAFNEVNRYLQLHLSIIIYYSFFFNNSFTMVAIFNITITMMIMVITIISSMITLVL